MPDRLTVTVVIVQGGSGYCTGGQSIQQAQLIQFCNCMGKQVDAHAQGLELSCAFKYVAFDAALVQHKCQGQPAYAGARDNYFQELSPIIRSEEHTSELQSLMRISYAVFCLKKKIKLHKLHTQT